MTGLFTWTTGVTRLTGISSTWLLGIGAFLAGLGGLLSGIAALKTARNKGKEEAKKEEARPKWARGT